MGNINYKQIANNIRVPGVYIELDASKAGSYSQNNRTLLIGQMLSTGSATPLTPVSVHSESEAITLFGAGSVLHRMFVYAQGNNSLQEIWAVPMSDNAAGVVATGSVTFTGTATTADTINLYVAGQNTQTSVAVGDTATVIAGNVAATINANTTLPVTAVATAGTIAFTSKHKGTVGNQVDLRFNYIGSPYEITPTGITTAVTAMSGGLTNPDVTQAIAAIGDEPFEYWVLSFCDLTTSNAINTELNRRWNANVGLFGEAIGAVVGSLSSLQTFGNATNFSHISFVGLYDTPNPAYELAAGVSGTASASLNNDPAVALTNNQVIGILAPPKASRFKNTDRQTLYLNGIACTTADRNGNVFLERLVTNYQVNAAGLPDNALLDINTLATTAYFFRYLDYVLTQKFSNSKLANDNNNLTGGQAVATPTVIKNAIVAVYKDLVNQGIVDNLAEFKKRLVVQRNTLDATRVDVLLPFQIVSPLYIVGIKGELYLQFPSA